MPESPNPVLCVCGAALEGVECLQRAHLRGPQPAPQPAPVRGAVPLVWANWVEGSLCPSCGTLVNNWSASAMVCARCGYEPPEPDRGDTVTVKTFVLRALADDMFQRKGTPDAWSVNEVVEVLRGLASGDPEDLAETRWDDVFGDNTDG